MNGAEHYREAERLVSEAAVYSAAEDQTTIDLLKLSAAQVHATLALAAATVAPTGTYDGGDGRSETFALSADWTEVIQ